jgi:hypothetical protein
MAASRRTVIALVVLLLVAGAAVIAFRFAPGTRAAPPKAAAPTVPVAVAPVIAKSVPVR